MPGTYKRRSEPYSMSKGGVFLPKPILLPIIRCMIHDTYVYGALLLLTANKQFGFLWSMWWTASCLQFVCWADSSPGVSKITWLMIKMHGSFCSHTWHQMTEIWQECHPEMFQFGGDTWSDNANQFTILTPAVVDNNLIWVVIEMSNYFRCDTHVVPRFSNYMSNK